MMQHLAGGVSIFDLHLPHSNEYIVPWSGTFSLLRLPQAGHVRVADVATFSLRSLIF